MTESDTTVKVQPKPRQQEQNPVATAQQSMCRADIPEERECPTCGLEMRLWASFYRCRNCGYKESCCF